MSMNEFINRRRKELNISLDELCEKSGVPKGTVSKITAGINTNPKLGTLRAICDALDCTLDDLILAEQEDEDKINLGFTPTETEHITKYRTLDGYGKRVVDEILNIEYDRCSTAAETEPAPTLRIKHSVYKASAGFGFDLEDRDEWDEIDIPDTPEAHEADFAVTIFGNSMEPIYHDSDIVLVKIQDRVNIGETGIFVVNGQGYIKQYGGDRLISVNSDYKDIVFTEGDFIKCAGKVIGIAG